MKPEDTANIANRDDLADFMDRMLKDYSTCGDEWENQDIPRFLEAFQAWLRASDDYYNNQNVDLSSVNPWRRIGDAFAAARIYEQKEKHNKPRHVTTTSRCVQMIILNYNLKPVSDDRRRWQWHVRFTFAQKMPLTKDSVENFYSVVASEAESFFGLSLNTEARTTAYSGFRGDFSPFEVAHCHTTVIYAGNSRIAFFDYSGCAFGVVDAHEGRLLWEQTIKSHSDLNCLWADPQDSVLRVQLKKSVYTFDIATGEQTSESQIVGTLKASGPGYNVVTKDKTIAIRTRSGDLQFKSANGIREIRRIESVLAIVEWQGPARVIDLNSGATIFEATPEPGSQFSQLHYAPNGPVILTQHFFDQPILTDVRFYESPSAAQWNDSTIGMSGNYAILQNGREIAYATRGIYDPKSGRKIGDF